MRPVVECGGFVDFLSLTMDQLVNQAAKLRYMFGGKGTVPIVVRAAQGSGVKLAAQHSQSLEAWFAHVPGLIVVCPSTPADFKGLLLAAIRNPNPVIFLEHKMLYLGQASPVPEESYVIPIGKADIKRDGTDVTIVATQMMVARALSAAVVLEREGISVEVIDPRTIRPLDEETILNSVRKTNRLIICHEAVQTGGLGAEIAALVVDKAFDWLDAPIVRIASLDVPMPFNDNLENQVIPSQARLIAAVRDLVAGRR
jgi:2-oxoisovalerate dehydrogenase E1 component